MSNVDKEVVNKLVKLVDQRKEIEGWERMTQKRWRVVADEFEKNGLSWQKCKFLYKNHNKKTKNKQAVPSAVTGLSTGTEKHNGTPIWLRRSCCSLSKKAMPTKSKHFSK